MVMDSLCSGDHQMPEYVKDLECPNCKNRNIYKSVIPGIYTDKVSYDCRSCAHFWWEENEN